MTDQHEYKSSGPTLKQKLWGGIKQFFASPAPLLFVALYALLKGNLYLAVIITLLVPLWMLVDRQ
jgi:hypothetical protein